MAIRNDVWEKMLQDPSATPMFLPLEFLKAITDDFSTERELGRGGYGVVYKGILRSGKSIAVKKLFDLHVLEDNKFQREVSYLMGIKHRNIVQFVGYCAESSWEAIKLQGSGNYIFAEIPKRLLCFEHVPNKSLDMYISDESSGLDWNMRYQIIREICGGLHYLHEECHIVHLDLKPENILMDATMVPKIADFGLSRIFGDKKSQIITESCVGSRGYMAPEYLIQGIVSIKADIFSLGVIIIEILTGSRDYPLSVVPDSQDFIEKDSPKSTNTSFQHFKAKILDIWRNRLHISLGDTLLEQIQICAEIGIQCIQFNPGKRPVTQHIIEMLDEANISDGYIKPDMSTSAAVQVLEGEKRTQIFQDIALRIEQVLDGISFDELGISEKVQEQIELIHTQLKRAKERSDSSDDDLFNGLMSVYDSSTNATGSDQDIRPGLSEKLQLVTISDLSQESLTLHEMTIWADPVAVVDKMSMLLKKIKDFVQTQVPASKTGISSKDNLTSAVAPDAFCCPISHGLMEDPVMVSTGQTYERGSITRWFEAGNDTCPKTKQKLVNKSLTPNYVLHGLIVQWCELNSLELEPPKRSVEVSSIEHNKVTELLQKLSSQNLLDQRGAAGTLRQFVGRNAESRAWIGDSGGIPVLVGLLSTTDFSTQEHVVTALLNISLHEDNKVRIVSSGAIPGLVDVLERGSMVARENAAATLFSLSLVDDYKVTIGASGSIPPLVLMLSNASKRGKKDAATALFNLCIYNGNKGKAVTAGLIPVLLESVKGAQDGMLDEALTLLSLLLGHPEAKAAIIAADAIPSLCGIIKNESPRNKENAASILLGLCSGSGKRQQHLAEAQEQDVVPSLVELARSGTDRAKKKAIQLLEWYKENNGATRVRGKRSLGRMCFLGEQ